MMTSSTSVPRLVVVDDTDPAIQYSPPSAFSLDSKGTLDEVGWGGPVWNKTMTGTTTNASLSYTFNGTFVRAIVAAQGSDCHWNCSVDNHLISSFGRNTTQMTNYIACDSGGVLQGMTGSHTLDMNIYFSPSNETQSVWLDSIQYQPLPKDPLDSVTLRVHNSDPSVTYSNSSGGWSWQGFESNGTEITGTSMNFAFNGSFVSLYSVIFGWPTLYNATTAFYTIDGNSSSNFELPGAIQAPSLGTYANILNYPLFTASDLSSSSHNLQVATAYNSTTYPQWLTIDYFMIKTNPATSTSLENPSNSTNSSSPDHGGGPTPSHHNVGPIVGGVLGGLAGLGALILLLYYLRRRRRSPYSGMMLDLTGGGPGYYRLQGSSRGDTLEITPFMSSAAPPGRSTHMRYPSDISSTAYTGYGGQQLGVYSSSGASSSSGQSNRSSGWNSDRFVMSSKNARMLQEQDDRLRRSEVRQHQDSGVRLSREGNEGEVVDVPPTYTES
ncbi:hypothetical protein GYMLUDRAFT_593488 [Collybiopsis luxurians FD-317 M1]|uniref:Mid2 domain-containing protein n=1 Tax=Collybiopsis luxurians FD-317 M1 TaxID=944289 RepID=A0A0D0CFB0_9AGAR|nr:hypothetical protein GYMLUDRAFT_593488 [Collybiopsis luxurians FD-317 M1]